MEALFNAQLTYHASVDRASRLEQIKSNIGLGQIVKEQYFRSWDKIDSGKMGVYLCITDTGITIVKDETKSKIITMYVTTYRELLAVYQNAKKIPHYLRVKVDKNQTNYIRKGKTVWSKQK